MTPKQDLHLLRIFFLLKKIVNFFKSTFCIKYILINEFLRHLDVLSQILDIYSSENVYSYTYLRTYYMNINLYIISLFSRAWDLDAHNRF